MAHWSCYEGWGYRARFACSYFEFWVQQEATSPSWHKAFADERVFVTVNPDPSVRSCWVVLAETGTRHSVRLDDWSQWLDTSRPDHEIVEAALAVAKEGLRTALPSAPAVLAAVNLEAKGPLLEAWRREQELQQRTAARLAKRRRTGKAEHNAECKALAEKGLKEGLTCPHCGESGKRFRLVPRKGKWLNLLCLGCNSHFEPGDLDQE
ncbi:MAG TPA: hypothetical protein DEA08_18760 [Planctomycetes bacterium]|mgnify:CR=1 FL=1|nr:hypothetical protein [Planctomycetota bacterium]